MIKVMVIEDDFLILDSIVDALSDAGITAHPGRNADDAAYIMSNHRIDAAILDVDLGPYSIDGIQLATDLATNFPNLPFAFLTSTTGQEAEKRMMGTGAITIMDKPFKEAELVGFIENVAARPTSN